MGFRSGSTIGIYRVEGPLGSGGSGDVYRAWDPRLERSVAIKVLSQHASSASGERRFENEVKAIAALSHPNIVVIHDIGAHGAQRYAVTELLEGQTLAERLAAGRLPWQEAVEIALAIAEGLDAAHSRGIVHRDLKPSNVLLTNDGRVKILDFGLALFHPQLNPDIQVSWRTPPGSVVGSTGYMSPEQLLGGEIDHRTDVFSFGCVLYEMLSGERAFQFRSIAEAFTAVVERDPPPLADAVRDLPPSLLELVDRCLRRNRDERPGSARTIADALELLATPRPRGREPGAAVRSVAVLPLVNASGRIEAEAAGDSTGDYLSDGISESIIRNLSRDAGLRVLAWSTTARYRQPSPAPAEIGRDLGVDAVLAGRLVEAGDRLSVSVELVGSGSGEHLWGEKYDRRFTDILEVQDDIADHIAHHLSLTVAPPVAREPRKPQSPEAYRLYLRGRFLWNKRTRESLDASRLCFEQALAEDPGFALAHAGLSDTYNIRPFWGLAAPRKAFPVAQAAARRALELDPDLADAHVSLAYTRFYFEWDWPAAERSFRRALELGPSHATAHHWYGVCAALRRDAGTAAELLERAHELDPLSLIINSDIALAAFLDRRPEDAVEQCRTVEELADDFAPAQLYRGLALELAGRLDEAVGAFEQAVALTSRSGPTLAALAHALARSGRRAEAETFLRELVERRSRRYVSSYPLAVVCAGLDRTEDAFGWLAQAIEEGSEMLVWFPTDPRLDQLRTDPRADDVARWLDPRTRSRSDG